MMMTRHEMIKAIHTTDSNKKTDVLDKEATKIRETSDDQTMGQMSQYKTAYEKDRERNAVKGYQ